MRNQRGRFIQSLRNTPFHPQWLLARQNFVRTNLAHLKSGRVLDIGCADRWPENMLPVEAEYVGLDYPATGRELYHSSPDVFADASRLPFGDASFNTVLLLDVLEHLRRPGDALLEIQRVLQKDGRLELTIPFLYPIHDAPHDYQRYTVHGLLREIEDAGLRVREVSPALGSAETAGLILCLALGGMSLEALRRRRLSVLLVPMALLAIPLVNLAARVLGLLLPSWGALTAGYRLTAFKP